jgi:hypothetical protein
LTPDGLFGVAKAVHLISEVESPLTELAELFTGLRSSFERDLERLQA